jgi:hypothetical protein
MKSWRRYRYLVTSLTVLLLVAGSAVAVTRSLALSVSRSFAADQSAVAAQALRFNVASWEAERQRLRLAPLAPPGRLPPLAE